MEFADRLKSRMTALGISSTELSKAVPVSKGTVTHWTNGTNGANGKRLIRLAEILKCDPVWLSSGKGVPPAGGIESNVEPGPDIKGLVPLISWVQAGDWCEVEDHYAVGDAEDWLPCPTAHGPRTYVLRVRGESMNNPHARRSFRDGDLIYVDPDRLAENGSAVIAKLEDSQEATFKQLVVEGEDRYLKPLNPGWPEPIIKVTEKATICGVVIGKYEAF